MLENWILRGIERAAGLPAALSVVGVCLLGGPAHAADTWTHIATGVDYLHRVESGSLPQDIHVAKIDLTNPLMSVYASNDLSTERGVNTRTFATSSGAIAAINGDWGASSTTVPISLAIGDSNMWNPHFTDPSVGGAWGFFACDIFNRCEAGTRPPSDLGFAYPFLAPYRYFNAVGANGIPLIEEGARATGCFDTVRNPRSGICVDANRETLYMFAVDGRSSTASGMTCDEMRDLAADLGCYDAAMLDGGGSTTLVVDGSVMNDPSDGSLRSRPNHIGVILASTADAECTSIGSGRWCDGTEINTCSGGRYLGSGDCALFGATCEEDGDWAYCVHMNCPDGDGNGSECLSETEVRTCTDGWLSDGDCAVFGLACGEDSTGASCLDSRCTSGPNSGFCVDATTAAQCTAGVYAETTCVDDEACVVDGLDAACSAPEAEPEDSGDSDTSEDGGDGAGGEADGSEDENTGGSTAGGSAGDADAAPEDISDATGPGTAASDKGGCASVGGAAGSAAWVLALGVLARRRRVSAVLKTVPETEPGSPSAWATQDPSVFRLDG